MKKLKNNLKIKDIVAQQKKHWVRVTGACNNNCLFCLDSYTQNNAIVPIKKIEADLKIGFDSGTRRVVLSGGEATLHPQLCLIIKKAKKLGYKHVQIITNGRMLAYGNLARELKIAGLDEITFSLHSHIETDFEKLTGIKNSYKQAMKGLLNAQRLSFIISVDIVINKINYKKLKETLQFFIALGVTEFDLLHLVPFGRAWRDKNKLFLSLPKAKKYLDRAFALSENKDLCIWTNRMPAIFLENYEHLIQDPIKLNGEIESMEKLLKNYVEDDVMMDCFGERCSYCFAENFCLDLIELKKDGILKSRPCPVCLKNQIKKEKSIRFSKKIDMYRLLSFYIKNRYFVKNLRCTNCKYDSVCYGAQINEIRKKGFKILIPQKK